MLYPAIAGFMLPVTAAAGTAHVSVTPCALAVAPILSGATATSSGTIDTRFDRSLRALNPSVMTAYVSLIGRPDDEWSGGASS